MRVFSPTLPAMSDSAYAAQLAEKTARLDALLSPLGAPPLEVFDSPAAHYRMRAEFRIWHEGEKLHYAMFRPGGKGGRESLLLIEQFEAASLAINALMPRLLAAVSAVPVLKNRLYQCEFLSASTGEVLLTLIYHKKLDDEWRRAAEDLQRELGVSLIGRSRGQKIVLSQDFVTEKLDVMGSEFRYRQYEGAFTQPNARVCEKMLAWACSQAQGADGDLLELYCGNGNFTLPLARYFRRALATELSKTSVAAAQWNIEANGADNIAVARLSAEEFAEAFAGSRRFRRLAEKGIDLADYRFSTLFVDPPRAGLDEATLALAAQFERVIYVSCNPETLRANLDRLSASHNIAAAALFDQFPFTPHIESGVLLVKKAA